MSLAIKARGGMDREKNREGGREEGIRKERRGEGGKGRFSILSG